MAIETESRRALHELIELLQEVDERWAGPQWNLASADDVSGAHRALMHLLEGAVLGNFESDPRRPNFRRIVSPWRKFTGDNGDAIYYDSPVSADYQYVVRGNIDGAVYTSFTIELDNADGSMAKATGGVINDTHFTADANGAYEIRLGGATAGANHLPLPAGATRITSRHYFENETCVAADPTCDPRPRIEIAGERTPPSPPDDTSVAAGIRRVAQFIRSRTLEMPPLADSDVPPFVSKVPNEFPPPVVPGDFGLAAFDAHYSMAPFVVGPDQALVLSGRWPNCRFANVCLWNRFQQTFDYANRSVSLNRKQTELEPDGTFRLVIAHRDPGVANWLDTEGRPFGIVFWRFMLAEGDVETPRAELVPFDSIRG